MYLDRARHVLPFASRRGGFECYALAVLARRVGPLATLTVRLHAVLGSTANTALADKSYIALDDGKAAHMLHTIRGLYNWFIWLMALIAEDVGGRCLPSLFQMNIYFSDDIFSNM